MSCLKQLAAKGICWTMLIDSALWETVYSDTLAAEAESRPVFTYINLSSRLVLPIWMTPGSIGHEDDEWDSGQANKAAA